MAEHDSSKGEQGDIELQVVLPSRRVAWPVRRAVLGLSAVGLVAAVVAVVVGLDEPASKVVVRSGGSDVESSISVGFTSTLPDTTLATGADTSTASDEPSTTLDSSGPGSGGVDSTVTGGPGPTAAPPPPTAQPPGPTSTVIPTLPPATSTPTTFTTTIPPPPPT